MKLIFTARHFKAHNSLKEFAESETEKLKRFYDGILKCDVILSYEKASNSVKTSEVIVTANTHHVFTSKESSDDFRISMEAAFDKVIVQIKKFKEKLKSNHTDKHLKQLEFNPLTEL
ncbi:MAG: ribosome hibernation-promoting factor, HPF/YfiA family [Ignavibacteria bacterium]